MKLKWEDSSGKLKLKWEDCSMIEEAGEYR